jgi:8-oxo-dGTP pyrophosphatase MutT (NUDIX family)
MSRDQQLAALLTEFVPSDATEADFRSQMATLVDFGPAAFDRDHFEPGHFTASAFIVDPPRLRLLLIHHAKLGRWLQPGGHVEPGDADILAAARREAAEEVGLLDLTLLVPGVFDLDIHEIPARGPAPRHRHYDVRFAFLAKALSHRAGSDALDARWVALDQLSQVQSDESVMRAVRKLY